MAAAPALAALDLEVFHSAGTADRERVAACYEKAGLRAETVAFEPDLPTRYRWADIAICRAGATTVAELSAGSYMLYCGKGVMSRLHASHLLETVDLDLKVYAP